MGLFRKKQQRDRSYEHEPTSKHDETLDSIEEQSSVPKEVPEKKTRNMGKWICKSQSSKDVLREDNKISVKPSTSSSSGSSSNREKRSTSSSGSGSRNSRSSRKSNSSSSHEDKRDDRQVFYPTTVKASLRDREVDMNDTYASSLEASLPPPAAKAAFDGPPRFDWIDIEYTAATRIQKMYRRHLVLKEMEAAGLTTSYIRNRRRQRKAMYYTDESSAVPNLGFGCCSMGLAFGNDFGGGEDHDIVAYKDYQRKQYEEKTRAQKEREEFLSQSYLEQKGIHNRAQEFEQERFNEMLLGL